MFAGEISAIYIGAKIREAPTPKPPIILAITSVIKSGANAEKSAETAYKRADIDNMRLLPYTLLKGPATNIAKVAVNVRELTAQPNSILVKPNSGSKNLTTPDMTEASKPIKKPPKATIRLIDTI